MALLLKLADAIDAVVRTLTKLAIVLVLVLVALVAWNVISRYALGFTPVWAQELEWHLLAPIALIGIASLMQERGHVRVDMLYERMGPRTREALDLVSMLVGVVIAILIIRYSIGFVDSAYSLREGSPDPGGLPYRYALKALIPFGFFVFGLQCLAHAIRHLNALQKA